MLLRDSPRRQPLFRIRPNEPHQSIGVRVGERPEQNPVDEREDCRRRANAQGKREGRDDREGRHATQCTKRVSEIRPDRLEPLHEPDLPRVLLVDGDALVANAIGIAEPFARLRRRDIGRNTKPAERLFAHREMKRELVVDVPFDRASAERQPKGAAPSRTDRHAVAGPARLSAPAMAAACRCQTVHSARYRARPAAVSL